MTKQTILLFFSLQVVQSTVVCKMTGTSEDNGKHWGAANVKPLRGYAVKKVGDISRIALLVVIVTRSHLSCHAVHHLLTCSSGFWEPAPRSNMFSTRKTPCNFPIWTSPSKCEALLTPPSFLFAYSIFVLLLPSHGPLSHDH